MIVCIDTTGRNVRLQAVENTTMVAHEEYAGDAVEAVAAFLNDNRLEPTVYCPVVGVGSFSATRTAVSVANALALADNVRAVEITPELWHTIPALVRHVASASARFAQASYSAPPRITKATS